MWILIILLSGHVKPTPASIQFYTKDACYAAMEQIKAQKIDEVHMVCVEAGF